MVNSKRVGWLFGALLCSGLLCAGLVLDGTAAWAQDSKPAAAEPVAPAGFGKMPPSEMRPESVSASGLVVTAYGVIFVLLLGYVAHLTRSQAAISREMRELAKRLADRDPGAGGAA